MHIMYQKIGWSALTRIQQREFLSDPREDIVVNHVHPGYVDTDLAAGRGYLPISPLKSKSDDVFS